MVSIMIKKIPALQPVFLAMLLMFLTVYSDLVLAHGERAQQAGLRMRTLHWIDLEIYPKKVEVGQNMTVKGKFIPSMWWPEHMADIADTAFLNIGIPGPKFLRIDSKVNGVPMIRSTAFEHGKLYEFEITLKARVPGEVHVHPVISVADAGPIIGPGKWVEIVEGSVPFENKVTALNGEVIDMETVGLKEAIWLNVFWAVIGVAWILYWFVRYFPLLMPRYIKVSELTESGGDPDSVINLGDQVVAFGFFLFTLLAVAAGYFWASSEYPITTTLQTGKVKVAGLEVPSQVDIKVNEARYRIPGRSFKIDVEMTNNSDRPVKVGEFVTANIRFINHDVMGDIQPEDKQDLIASNGLTITGGSDGQGTVLPGETSNVIIYADDAIWETYRLTSLIYDPDSRFAAMLQIFDDQGKRHLNEIGGAMFPAFR